MINKILSTSSILVGVPGDYSGFLDLGGISLTRSEWILSSPFEGNPDRQFKKLSSLAFERFIFESSFEQTFQIKNELDTKGGGISWKASAAVKYVQEFSSSQTATVVSFQVYKQTGNTSFKLSNLRLRQAVVDLLSYKGKSVSEFKISLQRFVSIYGYYCVAAYTSVARISVNWSISTYSEEEKQEITANVKGEISKKNTSVSLANEFINNSIRGKKSVTKNLSINSTGLISSITTIDEADKAIENLDDYIKDDEGTGIEQLNIISWTSISSISDLFIRVPSEYREALKILEGGLVSQIIWDEVTLFQSTLALLSGEISDKKNKIAKDDTIRLDEIFNLITDIGSLRFDLVKLNESELSEAWSKKKSDFFGRLKSYRDRLNRI